jgi:hypothetical protein
MKKIVSGENFIYTQKDILTRYSTFCTAMSTVVRKREKKNQT